MESADFPANPLRMSPYSNFRFRIKMDGDYVAGVSQVSGFARQTVVAPAQERGNPAPFRIGAGQTEYTPLTLSRGMTDNTEFEEWANNVFQHTTNPPTANADFRRNLTIEVYNEAGQMVLAYQVLKAWVSEFRAIPSLDGDGNTFMIESMTLQNEGWSRDA